MVRYRRDEDAIADAIRETRRGLRDAQRPTGTEKALTTAVAADALERVEDIETARVDEAALAALVPKAPAQPTATSTGAWTLAGPVAAVEVSIPQVTESMDGAPLEVVEYELWDADGPLVRVPASPARVTLPSGGTAVYRARARTAQGVWGDLSVPSGTVTGASPAAQSGRTPTGLTARSEGGIVIAAWAGTYAAAPAEHSLLNVRILARVGAGAYTLQGVHTGAGEQLVKVGAIGDTVDVQAVAYDRLGRVIGTSAVVQTVVKGIEFTDFDDLARDRLIGTEDALAAVEAGQVVIGRTVDGLNHTFTSVLDPNPVAPLRNADFSDGFNHWVSMGSPDTGGMIVDDPDNPANQVFRVTSDTRKGQGPFPVRPGEKWRLDFMLRSNASVNTFGLSRGTTTSGVETVVFPSTGNVWQQQSHVYTIPETGVSTASARFAIGATSAQLYVDDVRLRLVERAGVPVECDLHDGDLWHRLDYRNGELTVVEILVWDGQDWAAYGLWVDSLAAAGSVTARTLAADEIWADQAWLDVLRAGVIEVDMVTPNFGENLNLYANGAIVLMAGRQDAADTAISEAQTAADQAGADAADAGNVAGAAIAAAAVADGKALVAQQRAQDAQDQLTAHQAVFRVTPTGAEVSSADGSNVLALTPTGVQIIQGGTPASTWDAGRLIVNEAVVNRAQIGAHSHERYAPGRSIIRPI